MSIDELNMQLEIRQLIAKCTRYRNTIKILEEKLERKEVHEKKKEVVEENFDFTEVRQEIEDCQTVLKTIKKRLDASSKEFLWISSKLKKVTDELKSTHRKRKS